jgi:GTP cyclohydrolase FolE2
MNEKIFENKSKIREVEDMIDILGKNVSKDIYAAVRRAT